MRDPGPPPHPDLPPFSAEDPRIGPASDLASMFERQAAAAPERIALTFEHASLSYDDLNRRANRLAHLLRAHGACPERVVGVLLERSLDLVVAMLAVQKTGAVYLPLEATHPVALIEAMCSDAHACLVVTQETLRTLHGPSAPWHVLCLENETAALSRAPEENPRRTLLPANAAQIMFTSGTTGRPKGVTLTHAGLTGFLEAMRHEPGMTANDVILSLASCAFDSSIVEMHLPLVCGARTIMVTRDAARDGKALWEKVQQTRPSILNGTPATFHMLLEAGWPTQAPPVTIICGGETMPARLAAALLSRASALWNVYGPTEATALATMHRVVEVDDPIPIGRALPGTRIHLLDTAGRPVPAGETAEICIGGRGVTRGYLGRDELTRERFIADPFCLDPRARLYRSGDLGYLRSDGALVLTGRIDDQLKISGCRVEPGAVERVLEFHPTVHQAAVVHREGRLVAFLVLATNGADPAWPIGQATDPAWPIGQAAEEGALSAHVARVLPAYAVPAVYVRLGHLPLTSNGKIDRNTLRAMPLTTRAAPDAAPGTPLEQAISAVFLRVLGRDTMGVHESFATMGVDSLTSARIVRALEDALACRIPAGIMLRARTIAQLAAALQLRTGASGDKSAHEDRSPHPMPPLQ